VNRRVLLIDLDPAFRDTLTRLLNRYRVVVMSEPDGDRALGLANADPPSLIVIGVDEPDKAGFRVFQKFRKGATAKVPVILVTSTVSPDAFAKHRGLKIHADEYIDKRVALEDEIVAKIDNLVGLGDLQEDESIPVADDIPMDGDVLDEVVGSDDDAANEFASEHELRTHGPSDGIKADSMISAETDAAFDALLGDEPAKPAPAPVAVHAEPEPEPEHDSGGVPEPVPHVNRPSDAHPPVAVEDDADAGGIPEPVPHHTQAAEAHEEDEAAASMSQVGGVIVDESLGAEEEHHARASSEFGDEESPVAQVEHEVHRPPRAESSPAIPIADDEMMSLDDELVEEVIEDEEPAPAPAPAPRPIAAAPRPSVHEQATVARPPLESPAEMTVAREPVITEQARKTGSQPAVDLGLDAIAQDANREQSGVYDRKALRQISELERQITQLKTELERSRAAAETAAKGGGREAQFLNLRESMVAKDNELKQLKKQIESEAGELVDLREKVKVAQHAKTVLEQKNSELEQKIFDSGDKSKELAEALKEATEQARALDKELEQHKKVLAQLETDLATERANRAASASEAERTLRLEREQLIARHQQEVQAARDEGDQATETALGRQKEELESAHAQALHDAVEEVRKANADEHEHAVADIEKKHTRELVNLKADAAGTLSTLKTSLSEEIGELKTELADLKDKHAAVVAQAASDKASITEQLTTKHANELAAIEEEHADARERDAESQAQAIAQMKAQLDHAVASHGKTIEDLHARHNEQLEKAQDEHAQTVEAGKRSADAARAAAADARARHEAELAEHNENAARELNEQRAAVAAAKRAADEDAARRQAALEATEAAHEKTVADLEAKHERALAVANGDFLKQKAMSDAAHARTLEELQAAADTARSELEGTHAQQVGELHTERDELKRGLSTTRDTLKRTDGELQSALETIAERNADLRQHQAAIVERDQRIAELRKEIEALEAENASYQDQVLRAYQKIKADEAMVARARKAMAIALTVLDDEGKPPSA
jgi:CheY-like chemotaxis protein